jgi:hypothetical protein
MSYAPIYNKLHELDTRISTLENAPKVSAVATAAVPAPAPVIVSLSPNTSPTILPTFDTNEDFPDVIGFTAFATKAELPDVSGFATKAELPDVSAFATKAELPDVSGFATKAELPDVSCFATKAELPDGSLYAGFATKVEIADLHIRLENALNLIAELNIKINEAKQDAV